MGLAQAPLYAMKLAQRAACQTKEPVDFSSIKPFGRPFEHIPQYVFENCNQVTRHTWSLDYFHKLKGVVAGITPEKFEASSAKKKQIAQQTNQSFNVTKEVARAEGYDWIHGLNLIETEYLGKGDMTVEDIKRTNAALSRLTVSRPGEYRTRGAYWLKHLIPQEEVIFLHFVEHNLDILLNEGRFEYSTHVFSYDPARHTVSKKDILDLLHFYDTNRDLLVEMQEPHKKFDFTIVEAWIEEQKGSPWYMPGYVDFNAWRMKRTHEFPHFNNIPVLLSNALQQARFFEHPIARAAYVWFEIVRIHPWDGANKRTGRLCAAKILLDHGYLPPLITQEDEQEYKQILIDGFDDENGSSAFIGFVTRLVKKTQDMFAGKIV